MNKLFVPVLLIFLLATVVNAFVFWEGNNVFDDSCSNVLISPLRFRNITETYQFAQTVGETVQATNTRIDFKKQFVVYNLSGDETLKLFCTKNGDVLALPNPSDMNSTIAGTVRINASNFLDLPEAPDSTTGDGLERIYSFQESVAYNSEDPYGLGLFGDIISCSYWENWENESNWQGDGCVDKLKYNTIVNPYSTTVLNSSLQTNLQSMTDRILGFVNLNWQVVVVMYWAFMIAVVVACIGLLFAIPLFIYKIVQKLLGSKG